ncbi:winged helix-turn-helix transcriptional regulator [Providencia rettgeri]|nr:winged helix-turn-helix transcriptional regulator [Providencia rettgeri]HCI97701.1 transcriptional regulator [Providencia sp.]EJD6399859.1 winged helix-turn-helix transcriptional regulator [Providencia rettgeri]EJD6600975.1 winged helix-turn-helix transcriptional regulator [Providencia rettgeri]ELR5058851.1 winged helix-turn-helix transcriptional regulator [Providencia rettgeri]
MSSLLKSRKNGVFPVRSIQPDLLTEENEHLERSISNVASAIADPSRVSILCALMDGKAWTATELSTVAGVTPSTASAHLAKLLNSQLITYLSQGRHRYYRLAGTDIAALIETLMGVSMKMKSQHPTTTPITLRKARTCYNHLAGEIAVKIYQSMQKRGWILIEENKLSTFGIDGFKQLGIKLPIKTTKKMVCECLDWSERSMHLSGVAGAELLKIFEQNGWINRIKGYREVSFTSTGKKALKRYFEIDIT